LRGDGLARSKAADAADSLGNETGPSVTAITFHDGSTGLNQSTALPAALPEPASGRDECYALSARYHSQSRCLQTSFHHINVKYRRHLRSFLTPSFYFRKKTTAQFGAPYPRYND
jgi:hypothetical protein